MQSISNDNFGPLIAYLVPGATTLWGISQFSPTVASWFEVTPPNAPTISGLLFLTIVSLAAGMTITAIRWVAVDRLHAATGLTVPPMDFRQLAGRVDAYILLIEIHYRHYQFYANMFVATAIAWACHRWATGWDFAKEDMAVLMLEAIFFVTSRDTLRKYYTRTAALLEPMPENGKRGVSPSWGSTLPPGRRRTSRVKRQSERGSFAAE